MPNELQTLLKIANALSSEQGEVQQTTIAPIFSRGTKVFIRTVTHYHVGAVVSDDGRYIRLTNASWIADAKRWHDCLKSGFAADAEVEPEVSDVYVSHGSIVDIREWKHELPTKQQ